MKLCEKGTVRPYYFLVIDGTLASDNPLRFKKIFQKDYKNYSWQLMIR